MTLTSSDGLPSDADELLVEDFRDDVPLEAADFSAEEETPDAALESAELVCWASALFDLAVFSELAEASDISPGSPELPAESS